MRGRAVVFLVGATAAFSAATSAANAYIYWADYGTGLGGTGTTIQRANLDAAGQKGSFISTDGNPQYNPAAIVSDGTHVYWTSSSSAGYAIGRASTDGTGANPAFLSGAQVSGGAFGLAVTSSYIYWADGNRYIGRAAIDGTGANPHFIDMGSGHAPFGIAISQNTLYVGEIAQVVSVPNAQSNTPTVTTFAALGGSAIPTSLSIANGYVYWAELNLGSSSSIARKGLTGSGFNENYVPNLTYPSGVATSGSWVYWVDHTSGSIGRALDTDPNSATNVQTNFISDPGGPWGVAVDTVIDPTTTSVSCSPGTVAAGDPSVCTATVHDSASQETPTGTVTFSGSASTFFPGGNTCTLGQIPGSGGSSCTVGAQSASTGQQSVTGSYPGDVTHAPSNGAGQYCVGDSTVCGGGSGGGGSGGSGGGGSAGGGGSGGGGTQTVCKVPNLKGKTLAQARKLLTRAHCRLGKLKRPRIRKGHHPALVIGRQSPAAGRSMPTGTKVAIRLVPKPRRRPT